MYIGLQLYGPIACGQMDLVEMFKGLKKIGIDKVESCISLDGKSDNPSFWSGDSRYFAFMSYDINA